MGLTDGLKEASESEVIAWFEARPDYQEILVQDMRTKMGLHFLKEFKYVFDYTDFCFHPVVGLVPTYVLENLVDPTFEASADPDDFQRCIWKSLWFCIIQKTDHGQESTFIEPLEDFERIQFECEMELQKYWNGIESYLYEWKTFDFSNGRRFVSAKEFTGVDFEELTESDKLFDYSLPSGLSDFGHWARVLQGDNGRVFVHISAYGDYLMEVASNEEAERILNEIWG